MQCNFRNVVRNAFNHREVREDVLDYLLDPETWYVDESMSYQEILELSQEAYNRMHPDDYEWENAPLATITREAYLYAISVIRHNRTAYEVVLDELKYISGVRWLPDNLVTEVRYFFNSIIRKYYPDLYEYIEQEYYD